MNEYSLMKSVAAIVLAAGIAGSVACGQTFGGPFPSIVIPDNFAGGCLPAVGSATRVVTLPGGLPLITSVQIAIGINHTYYGDVNFTIDHGGTTVSLLGPVLPCAGLGDTSDLIGLYTFDDAAAVTADSGALATGGTVIIPPGSYGPDNPLAAFAGMDPSGPWTFTVWDQSGGVTGSIFDARVILGCATTYTVSQPGPGTPVTIAHLCGAPGNIYLSAFELGTAGVPNGWFYGLDVNFPGLLGLIAIGPPFFGTLDFAGNAVFVLPGVPPGITASSVGLHFVPGAGTLIFVSTPFTFVTI